MNPILRHAVIAFSVRNRRRKAAAIATFMSENRVADVVFVGCGHNSNANERIVEDTVAEHATVLTACDVVEGPPDPPWPYQIADGRDLPFEDGWTDMILANAVIEHVGGLPDQLRFVQEQTRVARTWVITTPNRWFPVESHTAVIGKHWSRRWRTSREEFTRLLSRSEFRDLLPDAAVVVGRPWSATFTAYYVSGPPTR